MAAERSMEMEEKRLAHYRETMDRLTAASHVQVEYFAKHTKIEGYYESQMSGNLFNCDRLMKQDNMFGTIQLGYNPNRERVFLFANMKTSRYDTVASRYQKEMKEYQKKSLLKGDNENRAYISKRWENASVLIEKKENKPWTQRSIKTYLNRANMEAVQKTLPFFSREEEVEDRRELRSRQKEIEESIRSIRQEGPKGETSEELEGARREQEENIRQLRKEAVHNLTRQNLLQVILTRKDMAAKLFLRRLNYAYDYQKKDIENYYREKKKTLAETAVNEAEPEDNRPEDEDR
ncbi:MAG: hypothetical protein KH452_11990 [Clostridiales bacterium]|nr:hypothetical protein [Clostridiales bacterium]